MSGTQRRALFTGILILFLIGTTGAPIHADDGSTYVVQRGDSLTRIAARHGITATRLAQANGLRWNAWVYVGQRLTIPGQSSAPPSTSTGGTYVVQRGDSLISIANRHGVTLSNLAAANGMRTNAWVYVGQRLTIPGQGSTTPAPAPSPSTPGGTYIVRPGDTLISIAVRHRVTLSQLAAANGLHTSSWVYSGQKLKIPGGSSTPSPDPNPPAPSTSGTYIVRPGDTLIGIATRHGIGVSRLAAANGLNVRSWVYVGQRLAIPSGTSPQPDPQPANPTPTPGPQNTPGEKWIDVNLTTQTLTAYAGQTALLQVKVSTGTWQYPTVVGTFRIYVKYVAARMTGPGYNLPNVPYVMYFYRGYGLHGTYWHNNFGTPMSHGCVNLATPDAKWVFEWAPVGTKVVTHY